MASQQDQSAPADVAAAAEPAADSLWYRDAVIYELHVKAFFDSNNDGIGDFPGLIRKLDYLRELGVTAIWLLPFYPSPLKDDGYDISDYRNVHADYGSRADFRHFVREAHRRDLRVITELVINHTSDRHPWFQAARRAAPGSSKRNFYVWSEREDRYAGTRIIFNDSETSNWAWDPVARAYYWHRFFSHQPDLNFDNPNVLKAVIRAMRFWLDLGVDGLRLDAIPYLCEREGTANENLPETHAVVRRIRAVIDEHYHDRMLLAEANQWPEDVRDYFGDADECHMAYHFPLMPRMYMAIAEEDRHPIVEILQQTPDIPDSCQWAIFLRNHDELTLEMVTSRERDYMYQMYATDPRARLNLGIRRRLAPLMDNDVERIKLMNALLLSMPGSPIIYYGDEIGMGDNIYLGDRNGVRTPMQWSPDRNAGFSQADPQRLVLPPIMDPIYGYQAVNVEAQARDPSSLLNWMRRVLAVRRSHKAFGRGRLEFLRPGNRKILAIVRQYAGDILLCVVNLARSAQPVELDLARFKGSVPVELLGQTSFPPIGDLPYVLTLAGYGFFWFRLATNGEAPAWHEERTVREEPPLLVLFDGWHSLFRERVVPWRIAMAEKVRAQLESEALPRFVAAQRWYTAQDGPPQRVVLIDHAQFTAGRASWLLALFRIENAAGASTACFFPLSLLWEMEGESEAERMRALLPATVARVRQQAQVGVLGDAIADAMFCRALVWAVRCAAELACAHGSIRGSASRDLAALGEDVLAALPVSAPGAQGAASAVALGHQLYLKCFRRVKLGVNPEVEVVRFLTEVAHFAHSVPILGTLEYKSAEGATSTLALLEGYVENQGDAWTYTLDYLAHCLDRLRTSGPAHESATDVHGGYLALMRTLGTRSAEMHQALGSGAAESAFAAETTSDELMAAWISSACAQGKAALDLLEERRSALPATLDAEAAALLARRSQILAQIDSCVAPSAPLATIRHHGNYGLAQVLLAQNDFVIIGFGGDPNATPEQSREKHSPLRDIASMLRSFERAAAAAVARAAAERPEQTSGVDLALQAWRSEAEQAFLGAYRAAAQGSGLYGDWNEASAWLRLFGLELAHRELFDELRNELTKHPQRVAMPLRSVLALTSSGN